MICDSCGKPMRLQGVGSYLEEGKEPRGTNYYFCCHKWKSVSCEDVEVEKVD